MSKFHATVRDVFEDMHVFLTETLQDEVLSTSALTHKEEVLSKLKELNTEYPQLQLSLKMKKPSELSGKFLPCDSSSTPSSPLPYVDMNGANSCNPSFIDYINSDPISDENYYLCHSEKSFSTESQSVAESEEIQPDEGDKDYPVVSASDLLSCEKCGFLEKKGRERLGGLINSFQRRWCAIKDGIVYYYEKSHDRRQKGMIPILGYEARPISNPSKDIKKSNFCFELVCPGKRTYQFAAASEKDMKEWIVAVEKNNKSQSTPESELPMKNIQTSNQEKHSTKHFSSNHNIDDAEDIYEMVEEEQLLLDIGELDQIYDEGVSLIGNENVEEGTRNEDIFNFQEWYIGLWDCMADDSSELSFLRGDLIHIISKDYDTHAWWIGEINDQIGFVPKSFLMEAYEQC